MRKEKLVTRNFIFKEAEILGFNTETSETESRKFPIPEKMEDEKKILKHISAKLESESITNFVPVKILSIEKKEQLRAMTHSKFYENSYTIESRHNAKEATNSETTSETTSD